MPFKAMHLTLAFAARISTVEPILGRRINIECNLEVERVVEFQGTKGGKRQRRLWKVYWNYIKKLNKNILSQDKVSAWFWREKEALKKNQQEELHDIAFFFENYSY